VTVNASGGTRINVALQFNGGVATASTTHSANSYPYFFVTILPNT
jgi:hypothetical protein